MAKKKMTEKEKQDWEALYMYVKGLMGYDENQALSNTMVLRLKGLLTNKFIENKNIESSANYSYETILNTFKYCKLDIDRALRTNRFQNEQHKFLYITKIVENNINNVYLRMKNAEKAKEEAKSMVVDMPAHTGAEFKPKEKKQNRFSDLW
jgi:CRISPR/Cas system endoribonuclease Cas6 (RAMP superfamily)